jgi:hypothetical protein
MIGLISPIICPKSVLIGPIRPKTKQRLSVINGTPADLHCMILFRFFRDLAALVWSIAKGRCCQNNNAAPFLVGLSEETGSRPSPG